jgi:hypothetical protein
MVIARGLGYYVIPLGLAFPLGFQRAVDGHWGAGAFVAHNRSLSMIAYSVSGLLLWYPGRYLNGEPSSSGGELPAIPKHHLFFIRLEYWSAPWFSLAFIVMFPWNQWVFHRPDPVWPRRDSVTVQQSASRRT